MKRSKGLANLVRSQSPIKKKKNAADGSTDPYRVKARCHVCGKDFMARYNVGKRAKVCTPSGHRCRKGSVGGRRVSCREKCCRSQYQKSSAAAHMDNAIDTRKLFNETEFKKFVKATYQKKPDYGLALRFIAMTGCRVGEAGLVRKEDFRRIKKIPAVQIPTLKREGRPARTVHIHDEGMVKELAKALRKLPEDAILFPASRRSLQRCFTIILSELGLRKKKRGGIHILRHTHASQLVAAGYDWNYIRQQLGWSSLEMARIYSHTDLKHISELGKNLPKVAYQ